MTQAQSTQRPMAPRVNAQPLIATLEKSHALYSDLLALIQSRRASVRAADFARFSQLGDTESRLVREIALQDQARLGQVRALATALALAPECPLSELSSRLAPAEHARVDQLRSDLRPLIESVRKESSVLRQAAERLSAHMAGILQSVHSALAHANVYSRGGRVTAGANVISSLDIRS